MPTPAWLGLGSNLGDRKAILEDAITALARTPGVEVRAVSSYHETRPVGGPPGQGGFLNAAAQVETTLDPLQLLSATKGIEDRAGRVRSVRWGERTLDIDLLIYANELLDTPRLKLPHPRLGLRRFALLPLVEIAPEVVDARWNRTASWLLANLDRTPRFLALHGPSGPGKSAIYHRLVELLAAVGVEGDRAGMVADSDSPEDPFASEFRKYSHLVELSFTEVRAAHALGVPWVVTDFCVHLESTTPTPVRDRWSCHPRYDEPQAEAIRDEVRRLQEAADRTPAPTFAVILPGSIVPEAPLGNPRLPRIIPEADDPAAIVAEVLATCRGIEGI